MGWTVPVLVDEQGTLIAGHGRVLAAQQLGITGVPTMVARGWTQAQIQAYRVTDNQLALNAVGTASSLGSSSVN
jgi:ParB-like chromosome segregation protein Spo0J